MILRPGLARPAIGSGQWLRTSAPAIPTTNAVAALRLGAAGLGTYLCRATIAAVATGTAQVILQVDDGTAANRYLWQAGAASNITQISRSIASVASTANGAALTVDVPFTVALAIDGAGRAAASLNGAAVIAITGGPTTGLTTVRFGSGVSGGAAWGGTIDYIKLVANKALSDAELIALAGTVT